MTSTLVVRQPRSLRGQVVAPPDKSLTHRAYLFGAFAEGESIVRFPLRGEDCEATLHCLGQMGLRHSWHSSTEVVLTPAPAWNSPAGELDCGNSGTTIRLISGLIASRPIDAILVGDASLSRRPMKRILDPLRLMGADVEGDTPPLRIRGIEDLRAIDYISPVASAQVKSCVLLAGLRADGTTSVIEPVRSRDHTERMLRAGGIAVVENGLKVSVSGGARMQPFEFEVPGDISSAAFLLVAGAIVPASEVTLQRVGVNPTRTGILDVFAQCANPVLEVDRRESLGEPLADLTVRYQEGGKPFNIGADLVPRLVDEIPVLAVLATQLDGVSRIRGAGELRVKESDRIEAVASGLRAMGAEVETFPDGMDVAGPVRLNGASIHAQGDHRIAMAFAVAGLVAEGETVIEGAESIATSYPDFKAHLEALRAD
ncbi:MAG TPA: 3-phosphoshikimate 1-carboxyvinyltransferase [Fimbriimonadaceae bacterium]|nr:3-phosphoshikimate 1-carboxyvinyltransferase [Fimbriimonadaceae bacterium]